MVGTAAMTVGASREVVVLAGSAAVVVGATVLEGSVAALGGVEPEHAPASMDSRTATLTKDVGVRRRPLASEVGGQSLALVKGAA